jgi:putative membrane protein
VDRSILYRSLLEMIAHAGITRPFLDGWEFDPFTVILLLLSATLYGRGVVRLWRRAGVGKGLPIWRVQCYVLGWVALAAALVTPLHTTGEQPFWAHMVQHELLMLVAAPLLVLSRPLIAMSWGLPKNIAALTGSFLNHRAIRSMWSLLKQPFVAWSINAIALWIWHLPMLFQATVDNAWIHAAQHFSFFFSALLFTWVIVEKRNSAASHATAIAYLFATAIHTSVLGVLLTFSKTVWYPVYDLRVLPWGLTPLEDQHLGGLIMWIPGGTIYTLVALMIAYKLLSNSSSKTRTLARAHS